MTETIIWFVAVWGCAVLFFGIGIFAQRREKPMWFWAGTSDREIIVTDVKAHNKAHAIMWKKYSLWYWVAGLVYIWSESVAAIIVLLSCSLGLVLVYLEYRKIKKKYIVE